MPIVRLFACRTVLVMTAVWRATTRTTRLTRWTSCAPTPSTPSLPPGNPDPQNWIPLSVRLTHSEIYIFDLIWLWLCVEGGGGGMQKMSEKKRFISSKNLARKINFKKFNLRFFKAYSAWKQNGGFEQNYFFVVLNYCLSNHV